MDSHQSISIGSKISNMINKGQKLTIIESVLKSGDSGVKSANSSPYLARNSRVGKAYLPSADSNSQPTLGGRLQWIQNVKHVL